MEKCEINRLTLIRVRKGLFRLSNETCLTVAVRYDAATLAVEIDKAIKEGCKE